MTTESGRLIDAEKLFKIRKLVADRVAEETEGQPTAEDKSTDVKLSFILDCLRANELGDGVLYAHVNFGKHLFNVSSGEWLKWVGHHWKRDISGAALAAVEAVVERYLFALDETTNHLASVKDGGIQAQLEYRKKGLIRRIDKLRSVRGRKNCLDFAASLSDGPLTTKGDDLDVKPWLLACKNGVIDLRTGALRAGRPEDYLMKASPVEWRGLEEPAPTWERIVSEIFSDNQNLVEFVQRLLGYSITGLSHEAIFPVLSGQGRNGKSLIVETISAVLGNLSGPVPSEMLLDQKFSKSASGPSPDIMSLRGLRMAFASETDEGRKISPSRVKWLTGGDSLTGRNPHDKYAIEFQATHTLFLLTNHKPHAPAEDFAFWERMLLIPLDISFVSREPRTENERRADKKLPDKLKNEAAGILAWLVRGCLLWQRDGLKAPEVVKQATAEYRRDEDLVGDFIDECCLIDASTNVNATLLYESFSRWFEQNIGKRIPKQKAFGKMMGRRFEKRKEGTYRYFGIGLVDDSQ